MASMRKLRNRELTFRRYWKRCTARQNGPWAVFCGRAHGRALDAVDRLYLKRNPPVCFDCRQAEPCPCPDVPAVVRLEPDRGLL